MKVILLSFSEKGEQIHCRIQKSTLLCFTEEFNFCTKCWSLQRAWKGSVLIYVRLETLQRKPNNFHVNIWGKMVASWSSSLGPLYYRLINPQKIANFPWNQQHSKAKIPKVKAPSFPPDHDHNLHPPYNTHNPFSFT
jgi:hypothetical protein